MNEQKLKNLIELVTFDQNFTDLAQKVEASQVINTKLQDQMQQLEKELAQHALKQHDAQKQLHDQEAKLQDLQAQETHLMALSQSVATAQEYEAANKEIDRIKFSRNQQEQKMMQLSNKTEAVQKEHQLFLEHYQIEKNKILELIAHENKVVQEMEEQLIVLQKARQEKTVGIPVEWLNTYETMRGRVSNPVVPINQDSCSACFYFMSSRDVQLLRDQGLLQCKDCFRFLYHESAV